MSAARRKPRKRKRQVRRRSARRPISKPAATTVAQAERRLRNRIQTFTYQPRFREEFEQALGQFFGEEALRARRLEVDETELPAFQEWFFFDYLTRSGETIIDIFAREEGPKLSEKERELLDLWRHWNRFRLLEVREVMPGTGVMVTDLLSGETLEVHDRSASHSLTRWAIFLARPLYTDRLHFTGAGIALPPTKKGPILDYSRQLLADFEARHPEATLDEFYQRHGLDIRQFILGMGQEQPVVVTPEGHELEFCTAYYDVADADAVHERLEEAKEFNFAGPSADHPETLHFNWLLRGRSHVPEQPKPKSGGLMLQSTQRTLGPGSAKYRSLGDINLRQNRLELSCMSRARLEAGKALLETLLGSLISHRRDEIESMEEFMAREPSTPPPRESIPRDIAEELERELLREQFEWINEPIPALGGKTPREAVQDPEGRAQVIELLKIAEYMEEQRRKAGEPWLDVDEIRRELGLPIP